MSDKKSGSGEAIVGWGIMAAIFGVIGYVIWWQFEEQIRNAIRWLRYGEMWLVSWMIPADYTVEWHGQDVKFHEVMALSKTLSQDRIDGDFLSLLSTAAMHPFLFLIIPLVAFMACWTLFKGPGSEHRQKFDLNGLIARQASNFPVIAPFVSFNPSQQPPRPPGAPVPAKLPLFAEALGPEEWIVFNEIPIIDKSVDEEAVTKALARQLGPRWRGAKNLDPYMQVMLAAFCLKASRKRADADAMIGRLAACWQGEAGLKLNRELVRDAVAVLRNQSLSGTVLKKCNEHAWVTTAMIRALNTAREEGGVMAPATFVWLRAHNRALWYPLNNLGRQSFHMEALGAMAHYKAEKMASRPIPRPKMADAVKSIKDYMASNKLRALPQMDYASAQKSGVKKLKKA